MKDYHKIHTLFKRDLKTKRIIPGRYSLPEFEFLKDNWWVFTEKVDGTNIRIMWDGTNITFGGKTDDAQIPTNLLSKLQELFHNKEIGEGTLTDAVEMARKGFKSKWGDFMAEGLVAIPKTELKTRKGERIITKIKYKDFKDL